ncbi:helix-turn-helix domain-containing protein [Paraburkholderia sp. GAS334]|uniref:helix-turn-helix domain-containing protein n=1 Tax=Paraburkholderia sp. GAS334 TaxID=3035131 RepID=UPI003D25DBD7
MKPQYERVTIPDGCSVRVYHRQLAQIPFEWHHHPEYELTLTMNSRGQRFIGDHVARYEGDDLVLVPPDMPHTWSSTEPIDTRAPGLSFGAGCAAAMRARLPLLLDASPRTRLSAVLDTLAELAGAEDAVPLASSSAHIRANPSARMTASGTASEAERLNRVFDLLDRRFNEPLRIAELCAVASLSERSLHRYFVQHVGESVGRYLIRLRLGYATRQLTETTWPVAMIATKAGFPNLANFNRQFLAARGMTPSAWRRFFEMHGRAPEPEAPVALDRRSPSLERRAKRG